MTKRTHECGMCSKNVFCNTRLPKMESLSEDLLPELVRALGNSTHSYAAGIRVSAVNTALRDLGARLPLVNEASCEMNVDQLVHVFASS